MRIFRIADSTNGKLGDKETQELFNKLHTVLDKICAAISLVKSFVGTQLTITEKRNDAKVIVDLILGRPWEDWFNDAISLALQLGMRTDPPITQYSPKEKDAVVVTPDTMKKWVHLVKIIDLCNQLHLDMASAQVNLPNNVFQINNTQAYTACCRILSFDFKKWMEELTEAVKNDFLDYQKEGQS